MWECIIDASCPKDEPPPPEVADIIREADEDEDVYPRFSRDDTQVRTGRPGTDDEWILGSITRMHPGTSKESLGALNKISIVKNI